MIRWAWCSFQKKCTGTHYSELVFLHPLGSVGHIVHSGASGPQNIDAPFLCLGGTSTDSIKSALGHVMLNLCFSIWWDLWSRSAFWCVRGVKRRRTIFHDQVGRYGFHKKCIETRYSELVFLDTVGYAGHVVNSGVRATKHGCSIFNARVGLVQIR
jgi:hypothetical protein